MKHEENKFRIISDEVGEKFRNAAPFGARHEEIKASFSKQKDSVRIYGGKR